MVGGGSMMWPNITSHWVWTVRNKISKKITSDTFLALPKKNVGVIHSLINAEINS